MIVSGEKIINLYGTFGIGKSTVCQEVVTSLSSKKYVTYTINATGCSSLEMLLSKFLDSFSCIYSKFSKNILFYTINNILLSSHMVIYIDNFEDCLQDIRNLDFVYELSNIGVQILLSSRCIVEGSNNIFLKSLNVQNCIKLFTDTAQLHGTLKINNKEKLKQFIIEQLDKHTLSIKLVASKAYLYRDETELIEAWKESKKQFLKDSENKNDILKLSIYNSFKQISDNKLSVFIWICLAIFPKELDYNIFNSIFYNDLYNAKKAVQLLTKHSMIQQNAKGYYMLQPIKDVIFDLVNICDIEYNEKNPIQTIVSFFINEDINHPSTFPIVSHILIFLIKSNQYTQHKIHIKALIKKCENIYSKFAYIALPLLKTIEQYIVPFDSDFNKETILIQLADLYHIVGDNNTALKYYEQAQDIKTINPDENIRISRKRCEIYRLFSEREKALTIIDDAYELACERLNYNEIVGLTWQKSEIYRLIDKNYDQALSTLLDLCDKTDFNNSPKIYDVFWSIGEIYQKKNKKKLARIYTKKSIDGFLENDNFLGLGYAYLSLANINKNLKKSDSLLLCEKAMNIFSSIGYDLGKAHAFLWKAKYYLKKDSKVALQNLELALDSYNKVGYKSGIFEVTSLITRIKHK